MKKTLYLRSNKDIRMMTDPYRVSILQVFKKNGEQGFTVQEIADKLGDPHGKVYYHVKKLENYGALAVDRTKVINGIVAKYYKLTFDTIDILDDPNTQIKNMVKVNETMKMIAKLYNDSRDDSLKFIQHCEALKRSSDTPAKKKNIAEDDCFVTTMSGYFTEENYPKFKADIIELLKKYSIQDTEISQVKKGIFLSVYTELDD